MWQNQEEKSSKPVTLRLQTFSFPFHYVYFLAKILLPVTRDKE